MQMLSDVQMLLDAQMCGYANVRINKIKTIHAGDMQ